ncbi:hypothetical protein [uncultured Dokdonia sp.]|uniref:Ig-like domain-containing protein n=1 Tax=uncultured Dokdonia sp. TaxID=575653 RepID=UPI0026163CE5|nr:hypothetical protein [uncultured Dokdonia sp.]
MEGVAQSPRFSFTSDAVTLEISKNQNTPTFKVYKGVLTAIDQTDGKKAVLGNLTESDTSIRFVPLLPFQKNSDYTVVCENEMYPFKIGLDTSYEYLHVETIYPNTTTLPSNFLKWYIRFSKPVNPSKIYDHIHLIDNNNTEVDRALLPLESPLLSDDGTLLTLWIEPGRQKRDLGPNKLLGEVLVPNTSYTLVIDKALKDHQGIPMNIDYTHSFTVTTSDRIKPTITSWELRLPEAKTKDVLHINFQEILDYGSLQNTIQVLDGSGNEFEGIFTLHTNQKSIYFTPSNYWNKESYKISCKPVIEDISGNNLERLFDRDITLKTTPPLLERSFGIE